MYLTPEGIFGLALGVSATFVIATLVTEEPLIVPSSPEATTATFAGPPGLLPARASASSLKNFAPPLCER